MILLIPGPVTTRPEVRAAMAVDWAPWDTSFRAVSTRVRARVLALAGGKPETHAALPLQGCGHFGTEAALRSFLPAGGRILILMTGQYAERMSRLATAAGRHVVELKVHTAMPVDVALIERELRDDPSISHVGMVYSETSTGVINDPAPIGKVVHAAGRRMIIDAVSAFGALPLDLQQHPETDAVVFTSNKCLEGLPGLCFIVAHIERLQAMAGQGGSWSFDLADIHAGAVRSNGGSFRFTPPAQVVAAFDKALEFYAQEGGQPARLARYQANAKTLYDGMLSLGLKPCLSEAHQGPIVVNIAAPQDPNWSLADFVAELKQRGFTISDFYNTPEPSFRVGCIGFITPDDMRRFVVAVGQSLAALGITLRAAA